MFDQENKLGLESKLGIICVLLVSINYNRETRVLIFECVMCGRIDHQQRSTLNLAVAPPLVISLVMAKSDPLNLNRSASLV